MNMAGTLPCAAPSVVRGKCRGRASSRFDKVLLLSHVLIRNASKRVPRLTEMSHGVVALPLTMLFVLVLDPGAMMLPQFQSLAKGPCGVVSHLLHHSSHIMF
jgi:hypothetical protein